MKQEDELFDDFLRKKASAANIQFLQTDWEMAQSMINQSRAQKRNNRRFIVLFAFMLLLATLSAIVFNHILAVDMPETSSYVAITTDTLNKATNPLLATTQKTQIAASRQKLETKANKNTPNTSSLILIDSNQIQQKPLVNIKAYKTKSRKPILPLSQQTNFQGAKQNKLASAANVNTQTPNDDIASPIEKLALIEEQSFGYSFMQGKELSASQIRLTACDTCIKKIDYRLPKKQKNTANQHFLIEGGLTYYNPSPNWQDPIDFYVGIRYNRFVSSKLYVSTGLLYNRLHQNQEERVIIENKYSFGVSTQIQTLKTRRLDYAEIPLYIGYCFSPKHSLQTGISFLYAIESSEILKTTNKDKSEKIEYRNGYRSNSNDIDWQLGVAYQYNIVKNWNANLGVYYGLSTVTGSNQNNGLKLGVSYKF